MLIIGLDRLCNLIRELVGKGYAIACVGTYLRSDDRAALEICGRLLEAGVGVEAIMCEHGLENCVHEIVDRGVKRLAVLDAAVLESFIEGVAVLNPNEVRDGSYLISTHSIPIDKVLEYLLSKVRDLQIVVVGIPIKNLGIGLEMSPEVERLVEKVVECFTKAGL